MRGKPVGRGQPDVHNAYTNNEFLDTRGLTSRATGTKAGYILQRGNQNQPRKVNRMKPTAPDPMTTSTLATTP